MDVVKCTCECNMMNVQLFDFWIEYFKEMVNAILTGNTFAVSFYLIRFVKAFGQQFSGLQFKI